VHSCGRPRGSKEGGYCWLSTTSGMKFVTTETSPAIFKQHSTLTKI